MGRTDRIRGRHVGTMPLLALALLAALLASLMTPATADAPFEGTVTFVGAPTTASPGETLDTFTLEVAGRLALDVLELVDGDGTLPLTASISLLQGAEPVPDAFPLGEPQEPLGGEGSTSVLVLAGSEKAIATFDGLTLHEDLLPSDELPEGETYELRVSLDLGDTHLTSASTPLEVTDNDPPVAGFSVSCDELTLQCTFEDTSTDDGTIVQWVWDFGDGSDAATIEASESVTTGDTTHTYPAAGVYTVVLTVTDDGGLTDEHEETISADEFVSDFDQVKDCDDEACDFEARIDQVTYTIQGPETGGRVGVSFGIEPDAAFTDACRVLQQTFSNVRVLDPVTLVVPTGFSAGDLFTVTMIVPKQVVNQDTNRGNFGVCFRDDPPAVFDAADPSHPFKGTTRLLPDCGSNGDAACIVSKNKAKNGTLTMTFRFPAVDPMFR
jgi:PKD repeat protein